MSEKPAQKANLPRSGFAADVLPGLTTAAVVVPKALAYATIAQLPVLAGLFAALVPMAVYAVLGTSRLLSVSTTTPIAILCATAIGEALQANQGLAPLTAAATLSALVGAMLLGARVLRLGFVANFISEPVLTGFKAGVGCVIVVDQVPKLLGLHFAKGPFLRNLAGIVGHLPATHLATLALLVGAILVLAGLLRFRFLANFISEPVLTGFKAGIGLVIVVDQVPKLLRPGHLEGRGRPVNEAIFVLSLNLRLDREAANPLVWLKISFYSKGDRGSMGYHKPVMTMALALLLSVLVLLPGAARAEMFVELYMGGVQGANASLNPVTASSNEFITNNISSQVPGQLDPAFLGGLKVGTWLVKEGFLGYSYPEWMKHLGFYLDFSYHRLNYKRQNMTFTQTITENGNGTHSLTGPGQFWSNEKSRRYSSWVFLSRRSKAKRVIPRCLAAKVSL